MSDWKPLLLSSIAGASTCIGAAIVFCLPKKEGVRVVKPGMMAFSLSLAGSVMVRSLSLYLSLNRTENIYFWMCLFFLKGIENFRSILRCY